MTFMSVEAPERFVKRLSELKGRESEEGRDNLHLLTSTPSGSPSSFHLSPDIFHLHIQVFSPPHKNIMEIFSPILNTIF